jgi:hypothetical protein
MPARRGKDFRVSGAEKRQKTSTFSWTEKQKKRDEKPEIRKKKR